MALTDARANPTQCQHPSSRQPGHPIVRRRGVLGRPFDDQEDISPGIADSVELLEEPLRRGDVVATIVGQPAQIAVVLILHLLRDADQPGRAALVITNSPTTLRVLMSHCASSGKRQHWRRLQC
jgi:hypothetical protein